MTFASSLSLHGAALLLGALAAAAAGCGGMLLYALEGVMLAGGVAGVLLSHEPAYISLLAAGAAGAAAALLWGALPVRRKAGQALTGLAFNGLAAAGAMIAARLLGGVSYSRKGYALEIAGENVTVLLPAALGLFLLLWQLLRRTRFGLRLRLCGEGAAEKMGVGVRGVRCLGLLLAGFAGGVAGLAALLSLGGGWRMAWGVGGLGYAALAIAWAGRFKPLRVLLFTALCALLYGGAAWLGAPEAALRGLPILAALLIASLAARKNQPASA